VGLDVRVGDTVVGKVSGLHTLPVQDLIVVTSNEGKEILVPFVEQIVPEVNVGEGFVLVTPPPGLFEVNAESDAKAAAKSEAAAAGDAAGTDAAGAPETTPR
jgi:16S rRNA processing protein RimM